MLFIFDTDSGFFADDGAALTMLLRSRLASSVLGITVVSGNVWAAQGVDYMRRNVELLRHGTLPVMLGAQKPLVHTAADVEKEGAIAFSGAFGDPPVKAIPGKKDAIDWIVQTLDRLPGQVTFIALGPLTNLALVLQRRPDLAMNLAGLVFMGGAVEVPGNTTAKAEFNFWFDPEAAQAVLRSRITRKVMFGLDIANQAPIRKREFDEIVAIKTPITALYAEDMGNRFPAFRKNPKAVTYMWDALVAGYLMDASIVTARQTRYLDVDVNFGSNYGAVIPLDRSRVPDATPVEVATGLDRAKAWKLYKAALTQTD